MFYVEILFILEFLNVFFGTFLGVKGFLNEILITNIFKKILVY